MSRCLHVKLAFGDASVVVVEALREGLVFSLNSLVLPLADRDIEGAWANAGRFSIRPL